MCTVAGCGLRYTTKSGLAHHVLLVHKEGTFRADGFSCSKCPRWFDRESALKSHLNHEHSLHFAPYFCPYCHGLWPGRPGLLLHMRTEHAITDNEIPRTGEFCPRLPTAKVFKSAHRFRLHLHKEHLRPPP